MQTVIIGALILLPSLMLAISQATLLFLSIEPGARANGMGRAYSAVADDAYAGWWNPGALAFNRKTQFAANHTPWFQGGGLGIDDMYYLYLAANQYFDGVGNLGVNIVWMDLGTQQKTDEFGNDQGEFHSFEVAAALSYGYELLPETLGMGANFKLISSNLAPGTGLSDTEGKALTFGFDAGAKYHNLFIDNLDASLVLQNMGPRVTYVNQDQADPMPMTFRAGLAYKPLDIPANRAVISVEASKILANEDPFLQRLITGWDPFEETIYSAGAEYTYLDLIFLRGGYFYDKAGEITGPSFGVGFQYTFKHKYRIMADFAMIEAGGLGDRHRYFSLGAEF